MIDRFLRRGFRPRRKVRLGDVGRRSLPAMLAAAMILAGTDPAASDEADGRIPSAGINRPGVALPIGPGQGRAIPAKPPAKTTKPTLTKQTSLFVHPARGFTLPIPAGVAVTHRGEEMHVGIHSPKGYVLNLQTGDASPDTPLADMLGKLERRYYSPEKGPWLRKIKQSDLPLAGLPAMEATYRGSSTRTRVVIARGAKTDFVFTFVAPVDRYQGLIHEFDWVLKNFRPGDAELTSATTPMPRKTPEAAPNPLRAAPSVTANAAGRPVAKPAAAPAVPMNRFAEPGFGFFMDYPKEWTVDRPSAYTAMFSGPQGTPAFDAVVSVQNVEPPAAASAQDAARIAADDLKRLLGQDTKNLRILGEGGLKESPGHQFIAQYDFSGRSYRKWAVVVPRPDGTIAHVWSFTAPDKQFDAYRPVAESMLRSWTLTR